MHATDLNLHLSAQYLAVAGKNFVAPKDDDSHTNMGWESACRSFVSRGFSNGDRLKLDTQQLALKWIGNQGDMLILKGLAHEAIVQWLDTTAKNNGLTGYAFDLHYTLDSGHVVEDFVFTGVDAQRCEELAKLRDYAQQACEKALEELGYNSEVRTWPHHFDTGSFIRVPDSTLGIGFGMAIPDSVMDEYYLYVSGYCGHEPVSPDGFAKLTRGEWRDGDFKGAVHRVTDMPTDDFVRFFLEAIREYLM